MGRRRRKGRVFKLGTAVLILLILLGFIILFHVRNVQVYGNERYTSEEIASGLMNNMLSRNTLYLLWKHRKGEIPDMLAYLDALDVQMKSPSSIEVYVREKELVAYLEKNGFVYIDQNGTVLDVSDKRYSGIPIVTGVASEEPVLYQKLPTQSSAQLRTILSLTQLLSYHGLSADEIRFGDNMEITIFIDRVEVQLGQDEYLEEKTANLSKILPRLDGKSGTLHLEGFTGRNEQVPFTPSAETDTNESDSGSDPEEDIDGMPEGSGEDGMGADGGASGDAASGDDAADNTPGEGEDNTPDDQNESPVIPMVFNSSGTLIYNVRIVDGTVVDQYGNPVPGVTVNEDGNVVDAYMNVIDPNTGDLVQ